MEKPKIKAAGIRSLTDARYFSAWNADWLSFAGGDVTGALQPEEISAIIEWVEGPHAVIEFGMDGAEAILDSATRAGVQGIQVGQFFPVSDLAALGSFTIFQEYVIEPDLTPETLEQFLEERDDLVDYYVFDFSKNALSWSIVGSGGIYPDIPTLQKICGSRAIFLDMPLTSGELRSMIENLHPWGLNIKGGDEEKVGFKSFADLDDIMEVLEEITQGS